MCRAGGEVARAGQSPTPNQRLRGTVSRVTDAEAARRGRLRRTYNITPEQYDEILAIQGGRCAICRKKPGATRFAVDHNHRTNKVRGLLCPVRCNHDLLGRRDQDPELFLRAYEYLTSPPADEVLDADHAVPARPPVRRKRVRR